MDTSGWIGLGVQLLGTVVTAVALIRDYMDQPDLESPGRHAQWPHRENPWGQPAHEVIDGAGFDRWQASLRRMGANLDRGVQGVGSAIEEGFEVYRQAAAEDWRRQVELDEQIVEDQLRRVRQQHKRSRQRVRVEFLGLLIIAVGTIISTTG